MILLNDSRITTIPHHPQRPQRPGLMLERGWKPMDEVFRSFREHHTPWELAVSNAMAIADRHVPYRWGAPSGRPFGEITEAMPPPALTHTPMTWQGKPIPVAECGIHSLVREPSGWRECLQTISARDINLGDRLLLPAAYPSVHSFKLDDCYLSGPVSWLTDLSNFRSGYGIKGDMVVHFTDRGWAQQIQFDLYGIDFHMVYVYRPEA